MHECERSREQELAHPSHHLLGCALRLIKLHRSILNRELNKSGVYRSQHQLLIAVSDYPNASQRELSELLEVSAATIAVSLKKLEKGGYISRLVDQVDNRFNQIKLTDKGKAVLEQSRRVFQKVEEQMFQDFTPEEYGEMEALLERTYRNLQQISSNMEREGL